MIRRPPRSTRTDTLFPHTTLFRSIDATQGVQYENLDDIYSDHSEWFVDDGETPADALERADLERALAAGIRNLPERDALVLQLYYVEELRSEERRVGTECVSTCRSRWSPYL